MKKKEPATSYIIDVIESKKHKIYYVIRKNEQLLKKRKKRAINKKILNFKIVNPE